MRDPAVIQRASTTFCWLPPLSLRQATSPWGARIRRRAIQSRATARSRPWLIRPRFITAGEVGEGDVLGDRQEHHEPLHPALARDGADAQGDRLARAREPDVAAEDPQLARRVRQEAADGAGQLLPARAEHARDAHDLARRELQVEAAERALDAEILGVEQTSAAGAVWRSSL